MIQVEKDSFAAEVEQSKLPVVVDFWGPSCGPCLALMPDVEKLGAAYEGRVKFCKVNVAENRRLCIAMKVMSVPTILFFKGGECQDRLVGDEVSLQSIKEKTEALLK